LEIILGFLNKKLYQNRRLMHIMSEVMCMVCQAKAFEIEIQEDSEEIPELKKGNKYCLDCYGPLQEQFKLTLEDVAEISSVSKE
tara:strand:- start:722 stop:973 length:252 start_codon:yes stop_codon:yes gene_type:complete